MQVSHERHEHQQRHRYCSRLCAGGCPPSRGRARRNRTQREDVMPRRTKGTSALARLWSMVADAADILQSAAGQSAGSVNSDQSAKACSSGDY
jgi:hypothetical protein